MEDLHGDAFVGPAGRFLRKHLNRAGLESRNAAYLNTVACFPHGAPEPEHTIACTGHFREQFLATETRYALLVGRHALKAVIPSGDLLYTMGVPIRVHEKVVFTVFHPAFILRSVSNLDMWQNQLRDFALIVMSGIIPDVTKCIYCEGHAFEEYTCHRHMKRWDKDRQWKKVVKPVDQESLF